METKFKEGDRIRIPQTGETGVVTKAKRVNTHLGEEIWYKVKFDNEETEGSGVLTDRDMELVKETDNTDATSEQYSSFMNNLIIERTELRLRYKQYYTAVHSKNFKEDVGETQYKLIMEQMDAMETYEARLADRIFDLKNNHK